MMYQFKPWNDKDLFLYVKRKQRIGDECSYQITDNMNNYSFNATL